MPTPLVLVTSVLVDVEPPLVAPTLVVVPLHYVAQSVPAPTLVNGRPT